MKEGGGGSGGKGKTHFTASSQKKQKVLWDRKGQVLAFGANQKKKKRGKLTAGIGRDIHLRH